METRCSADTCIKRNGKMLGLSSKSFIAAEQLERACREASISQEISLWSSIKYVRP